MLFHRVIVSTLTALVCLLSSLGFGAVGPHPASPGDLHRLKDLDAKYQKARSVSMDFDKVLKLSVQDQEKKSSGRLILAQGKMRMEVDAPDRSLVVINKKEIWIVNYPTEEFKNAALQIARTSIDSKKGRTQNLVGLLVSGGILKYFKVLSVQEQAGGDLSYFLTPLKPATEVTRAAVTLAKDKKEIKEVHFWDELNNETGFVFTHVSIGKKISVDKFQYTPPKNAEITVL